MDDKTNQLHELEQALATLAENCPPMWHRLYINMQSEGFTKDEAFKLLVAYVHGAAGGKYVG